MTDFAEWSTRRKMLAALLGGAVTGLGQAPFSLIGLALIGLLAGFVLFQSTASVRQAALTGWAFGVGYFTLVLSWIVEPFLVDIARHGWMAPFALVGMAGGMALFWGLAFGLARWQGRAVALVVFWTAAEVARTYILTGFPWGLLGYVWLDAGLDQMAAHIGPHGLTLLTLAGIWALHAALQHPKRLFLVPAVVLPFAGMAGFGLVQAALSQGHPSIVTQEPPRSVVRLIQPNAPQHQKWNPQMIPGFFERNLDFTATQAVRAPDLIIWPETAVPYLLSNADGALAQISAAAGGIPVVLGIQRRVDDVYHNSLVVLNADGTVGDIYDKSHLVPFGEYVPGGKLASMLGLNGFAAQEGFGFGPGTGLRLLDLAQLGRALPLICYEAIFPHEVGGLKERADWMLQITNDAWFGDLTGPYQHLALARFRAIEQGVPMVRAANTGVSAVIDARGQITASLPLGVAGYLDAELPHRLPPTLYGRSGDWPILLLLIAAAAFLFKRRRVSD
ncbi:MAG: apolipoprotein N-acyltransferase [Marinosulfonomonas sp.]|nr:apolipoprotein N-acyltransferase [Marinosulfonomonas sp.]